MATFGQLKSRVAGLLGRDDATDAPLDVFINTVIDRLSRLMKLPALEVATTATVQSGYVILPADMAFIRLVYRDDGTELETTSQDGFLRLKQRTGDAEVYFQVGPKLYLAPVPDDGAQVGLMYWRYEVPLLNDGDTNTMCGIMADALVYGALSEAAIYFDDDRADRFEAEFQKRKGEVEQFAADFYASLVPQHQQSYFSGTDDW